MEKRITLSGFSDEIDKDIIKQMEGVRSLGMRYFCPRNVSGKNISTLTEAETEELAKTMAEYGVKACCIGSPIGKIGVREEFEPHMEELKNTIRIAKQLGTKYIRIFSFYLKGENPEDCRDEVMRRMRAMVALAEKEDVMLLHENEKGIYGDTAARCADILETVQSPALGCIFDSANFVQCKESCEEAFEKLAPYITYMHIKDAVEDGTVVPAGMGKGYISGIFRGLMERGYSGFACLEPHLGSFEGLQDLEESDEMLKLEKSSIGKFKLAHDAFCSILEKEGIGYE